MKYCEKCGASIYDDSIICPRCSCEIKSNKPSSSLSSIAKAFMIIGCIVSASYFFVPLCWTIPMTLSYCDSIKHNKPISTGFKVCSLLFVNVVAGILMLCDSNQ